MRVAQDFGLKLTWKMLSSRVSPVPSPTVFRMTELNPGPRPARPSIPRAAMLPNDDEFWTSTVQGRDSSSIACTQVYLEPQLTESL